MGNASPRRARAGPDRISRRKNDAISRDTPSRLSFGMIVGKKWRIPSKQALCEVFGIWRPVVGVAWGAMAGDRWIVKLPRTAKGPVVWEKTFEFTR